MTKNYRIKEKLEAIDDDKAEMKVPVVRRDKGWESNMSHSSTLTE